MIKHCLMSYYKTPDISQPKKIQKKSPEFSILIQSCKWDLKIILKSEQ